MADSDVTKAAVPVALKIGCRDRKFLKEMFEMARDGASEELRTHGRQVSSPVRLRRELAAYELLLEGLDRGFANARGEEIDEVVMVLRA